MAKGLARCRTRAKSGRCLACFARDVRSVSNLKLIASISVNAAPCFP
jgi:hypothetical protein